MTRVPSVRHRRIRIAALLLLWLGAGAALAAEPLLVIHGGAGVQRESMTQEREAAVRAAMAQALKAGQARLAAGKPALDAVTAAITVMEDSPVFNAGRGAVFTHEGRNELDASIMDGATLDAGAVAGVSVVKNPILLARAVMEQSPHVMLARDGAEAFARQIGAEIVAPAYFHTEERWQQLQQRLRADRQAGNDRDRHRGTVGAVARDSNGNLAAGTSTGGMTDKRWGRIGDSAVIGAGTYASAHCAFSGTGWGEYYIRTAAAHAVCVRIEAGARAAAAAQGIINRQIPALGGDGGAIVLTADGQIATPFNTEGMPRGWIGVQGEPQIEIFEVQGQSALSSPAPR